MNRPELHIAAAPDQDTQDCEHCAVVLRVAGVYGIFPPGAVVAMPDGHYTSARLATDAEKRVGIVCVDAVRPRATEMGGPL